MPKTEELFLACCVGSVGMLFMIMQIATGSFAINKFYAFDAYAATGSNVLAGVYDMGRDWDRKTFTDIEVIDTRDGPCAEGWEPAYERIYYGMDLACDCLGKYGRYLNTEDQFLTGDVCDQNQTRYGCGQVDAFPPVYMHILDDKLVCGKTGSNFREAVRPFFTDTDAFTKLKCPEGHEMCLEGSEDSFCVPKGQDWMKSCPATDIKFVADAEEISRLKTKGYTEKTFDATSSILFSKTKLQRPVTTLKIGPKPCGNPSRQANNPSKRFYPTELMKTAANCFPDSRFEDSGFTTNEHTFMNQNTMLAVLESKSSYWNYVQSAAMKDSEFKTWNRPTWSWSLKCEQEGKTRGQAYEVSRIQLTSSGHELHVGNCGVALATAVSIMCICGMCSAICTGPGGPLACFACAHCFWFIVGPILLTSLAEMQDALDHNIEVSDEFVIFDGCAEQGAVVDTSYLQAVNERTLNDVLTTRNMALVVFGLNVLECLSLCCVGLSALCAGNSCSGFRVGNICEEFTFFMKLIAHG